MNEPGTRWTLGAAGLRFACSKHRSKGFGALETLTHARAGCVSHMDEYFCRSPVEAQAMVDLAIGPA